ncbi:MAG: hypothetical protein ABIK61_03180 [candidate division WOR-3 bacterium]
MFHFRVDGKSFPNNYGQVAREGLEDIKFNKYRYGHFLVSSRYDRAPILEFGEGLSEFYLTGWKAMLQAEKILGIRNPKLKRIYYIWLTAWFEFEGKRKKIVIHSHLTTQWSNTEEFIIKGKRRNMKQNKN